jgi:hypothetical protein
MENLSNKLSVVYENLQQCVLTTSKLPLDDNIEDFVNMLNHVEVKSGYNSAFGETMRYMYGLNKFAFLKFLQVNKIPHFALIMDGYIIAKQLDLLGIVVIRWNEETTKWIVTTPSVIVNDDAERTPKVANSPIISHRFDISPKIQHSPKVQHSPRIQQSPNTNHTPNTNHNPKYNNNPKSNNKKQNKPRKFIRDDEFTEKKDDSVRIPALSLNEFHGIMSALSSKLQPVRSASDNDINIPYSTLKKIPPALLGGSEAMNKIPSALLEVPKRKSWAEMMDEDDKK